MEGNRILRKDRQEGQGGGVSLCVSDQLDWGWMRSQPRADGSGLKEGEGQCSGGLLQAKPPETGR